MRQTTEAFRSRYRAAIHPRYLFGTLHREPEPATSNPSSTPMIRMQHQIDIAAAQITLVRANA